MHGRDGRFDLVAGAPGGRGLLDQSNRAGDGTPVTEGAVLVLQQDQAAAGLESCRPAGEAGRDEGQ